jgi:hypothetical protein
VSAGLDVDQLERVAEDTLLRQRRQVLDVMSGHSTRCDAGMGYFD